MGSSVLINMLPALVSALVTVCLVPAAIHLANRWGLVDQPSARKVHHKPIPRIGGIAILLGWLAGSSTAVIVAILSGDQISSQLQQQLLALLAASVFVTAVGFIDDVRTISARFKLLTLLFSAAVICGSGATFGGITLGGREIIQLQWLDWATTLVWIAGITVAVNFIDGLDGLASGIVALSAAVLAVFVVGGETTVLAALCLSLVGSLAGFLVFNRHPAKIFMGDCGSMFIGVCIATLMLMANPQVGTMRGVVLPALALSIPIVDGSLTFFRRHYLQRRSIFSAERGHIHHRLLDRGLKHNQAVWVIYAVSVICVLIGFMALAFDGWATLAGLGLLVPILWGTLQFAGSVRTDEMLTALRTKRDLDRDLKQSRSQFETLQLEFDNIKSFAGWWSGVCHAAEELNFVRLQLKIRSPGKPRHMSWTHPNEELLGSQTIHAVIPVPDSSYFGGSAEAEVDIAVTKTVELASERLAHFSRLTTENSLADVRRRERVALSSSGNTNGDRNRNGKSAVSWESGEGPSEGPFSHLKVALVHDFLYTYGGAERVIEQLIDVFPHCDVFALFDFLSEDERDFLRGKPVTTTFLQRLPFARTKHRAYLPLMPFAIEQLDIADYDLVISSSYLAAKGVITGPNQLHVCYCHSPARYAWDLQHQYLRESDLGYGPKGLLARLVLHYLRSWDVRSSLSVDHFIANSRFVARRIQKLYRRKATVIHPPVNTDRFEMNAGERDDFYLVASRMVPYKRTDLIVRAFRQMPDRKLVVIGDGPEMDKVRQFAGENVTVLGYQPDDVLTDHMRRAKAFIFAAEEDFGIVPVEAMSCGTPVIAFGKGGVTESVVDGEHGLFFGEQTEEAVIDAVKRFESKSDFGAFDPSVLREHSLNFSAERFRAAVRSNVRRWTEAKLPAARQKPTATSTNTVLPLHSDNADGSAKVAVD